MALEKVNGVLKLTPETRERLEGQAPGFKEIQRTLKVLKGLGLDVSALESKLDWGENVRTTLLKEF